MSAPVEAAFQRGQEIYNRDAHCATCHGKDGLGAIVGLYPPLQGSEWIGGNPDLLLKIILKGIWGKITVNKKTYDPATGMPPMTPFESILSDQEIADVASYVRIVFGDKKVLAESIPVERVTALRNSIKDKTGFYTPEELLKAHPVIKN